ncbi:MAG TPA: hypothetical protein PKX04_11095 [Chitinophagales bacterium]|nr:hypothetical protein [Chitinophagales bacterium]
MNRGTVIAIVVGVTIATGFVIWMVRNFNSHNYFWYETYRPSSDQPYGLSYTVDLLEHFQDEKPEWIRKDLITALEQTQAPNYLFIGEKPLYTDEMADALIAYISKGNHAMIAANEFPVTLMGKLFNDGTEAGNVLPPFNEADGFQDTNAGTAILNSYHDKYFDLYFRYPGLPKDRFRFSYRVRDQKESHSWRYFQTDTGGLQVAAHDDRHYPSMLDLTIGNGHLYLFCNPVLLTNIYAVDSNKIPFFNIMFSHLEQGGTLLDEYSKIPPSQQAGDPEFNSPLRFILSQPSLRSAWYTLLAGAFLFVLFRGRREQQVIPLAEPNVNRSLEFAMTVGRMHYLRGDHLHLVQQQMRLWRSFVKDKYQLVAGEDQELFISKLSMKSQVPESAIRDILDTYKSFKDRLSLKEKEMTDFYTKTRTFYKSCQ